MAARLARLIGVMSLVLSTTSAALGAGKTPTVLDVLFENRHLDGIEAGSNLDYRFERKVSDAKMLGQPFSDAINVAIKDVTESKKRNVEVTIFTGDRERPKQDITDLTGNPLLVIFLDRAVNNFKQMAGGRTPYLKNRFKVELRESAKITPTKVDYNGKKVDGYKVSVTPYIKDPNRHKMHGYEGSRFDFVVSEKVPGHFVELVSVYESPLDDSPRLEERISLAGVKESKK